MKTLTVAWFSAGVSSAVATKLAIKEIDEVYYIHIDDQHPDSLRFVRDCEVWFGKPITILQSPYKTVEAALRKAAFIRGPHGSPCTQWLKKRVRAEWEMDRKDQFRLRYAWGMDSAEAHRAERVRETMRGFDHSFPLIENGIGKRESHEMLRASGIKRPQCTTWDTTTTIASAASRAVWATGTRSASTSRPCSRRAQDWSG